jgi:hypothetical protein
MGCKETVMLHLDIKFKVIDTSERCNLRVEKAVRKFNNTEKTQIYGILKAKCNIKNSD